MLKIKDLVVQAGDKTILNDFNLTVPNNEIHVIMGPNGVGKSTICKVIMGSKDYQIKKGIIEYDDDDLTNLSTNEIAQKGIFYLFQNPTEIPGITNAELLRTALVDKGIKESIFEFNKRLSLICDKLNIDKSFIHRNINENMSGGEKKKNELLQLYVLKPDLILLDELDSGLDIDSLKNLSKCLMEYKEETNASIIIITHHTNILEYMKPDKVYVLNDGKIVEEGDLSLAEKIEKHGFKGTFNTNVSENHE